MAVALHHEEAGAGRPVVLLHAFPLSSAMWSAQRDGLADICRVLTPDLRGFGASPLADDDPDLDAAAEDVAALLDRLGLDRVVLGGCSLGGYVAMAMLRRVPERVTGLVLVDTKAGADPQPAREKRENMAEELLSGDRPGVLVEDVLPTLLGETTKGRRPEVLDAVHALVEDASAEAAAWFQRAMAARPDSFPALRAFQGPALLIVGEDDALAPPAEAEAMAEALSAATVVRVPEAGHLSPLEAPERVNEAVRLFLSSL